MWLVGVSLFFYGSINRYYVLVLLSSIGINYLLGMGIQEIRGARIQRIALLILGISLNLVLLAYFKYYDFFISNANLVFQTGFHPLEILLPVGISFFTFQQVSYLIDLFRGQAKRAGFLDYLLFVAFFPKLINGPLLYHESIAQFQGKNPEVVNYDNLSKGLYIFFVGLFKKMVIADTLSIFVAKGFDHSTVLTFTEGWITSLSYTFQIYFDFSGYTDMAIGLAWMFNIALPFNFNSPYHATNIGEFWNRWHMTLTRFLRDYLYIPLGGNRGGELNTFRNILVTFLFCGVWHGAGWTFISWGFLHGLALIFSRLWNRLNLSVPSVVGWFVTFSFINVSWIFFRAKNLAEASNVLRAMFGFTTLRGVSIYADMGLLDISFSLMICIIALLIVSCKKNSNDFSYHFAPSKRKMIILVFLIVTSMVYLNSVVPKGFIYNDF